MKFENGKAIPENLTEQEQLFLFRLCNYGREIEQLTSDKNEQIQLKMALLKSSFS